jgi:helix-turn-helix protein
MEIMATVNFDTLVELYMTPRGEPAMAPLSDSVARRLRDALEPLAIQALWSRGYFERTAAKGVGLLESYVWGRAAALGEPAPAVVVAAFGAFERDYLMGVYESGRSQLTREEVLAAREAGAIESMTAVLGGEDPAWLADTLLDALRPLDGSARPLFSGLRELPVPADPNGRLWRAAELVREHRGDGHLAACVAAGLGDRVEQVIDRAQELSALLISACAVPADPRKLAAG